MHIFDRKPSVESKLEKVPRGIISELSRKECHVRENWS